MMASAEQAPKQYQFEEEIVVDMGPRFDLALELQKRSRRPIKAVFTKKELRRFYAVTEELGRTGAKLEAILEEGLHRGRTTLPLGRRCGKR